MKKINTEFVVVKNSKIHNKGVFAKKDIPKGTEIIEYVGEKITKKEAEKRAEKQLENSKNHSDGGVYIFELNKRYDIDGKVPWNPAQFINHSCNPNCESETDGKRIWFNSIKDIKKSEEITYNYSYGFDEEFEKHPCKCGSKNCVGYILAEKHWKKLNKK